MSKIWRNAAEKCSKIVKWEIFFIMVELPLVLIIFWNFVKCRLRRRSVCSNFCLKQMSQDKHLAFPGRTGDLICLDKMYQGEALGRFFKQIKSPGRTAMPGCTIRKPKSGISVMCNQALCLPIMAWRFDLFEKTSQGFVLVHFIQTDQIARP